MEDPFQGRKGEHGVPLGEEEMGFTGFLWGRRSGIVEGVFRGMRRWGLQEVPLGVRFLLSISVSGSCKIL